MNQKINQEKIQSASAFLALNNRETVNTRFGLFCEEKVNGIGGTTKSLPIIQCIEKMNFVYKEFVKPVIKLREYETQPQQEEGK